MSKNETDEYKFFVTLLTKKYPLTKATYVLMKATLDSLLKHKYFNTLISLHGLVVKGIIKKISKDLALLSLAADLISVFILGFQVHSNYFITECFKPLTKFIKEKLIDINSNPIESVNQDDILDFVIMMKAAMLVHSGNPGLYQPVIELIDNTFGEFLEENIENDKIENKIEQFKWKIDDSDQENINKNEAQGDQTNDSKSDSGVIVVKEFKYKGLNNMGNT